MITDQDRVEAACRELPLWKIMSNAERRTTREIMSRAIAAADAVAPPPADRAEQADVLGYATRLVTALWEKHWQSESPHWKPLPDLIGVLTQIDNMTVGLVRTEEAAKAVEGAGGDYQEYHAAVIRALADDAGTGTGTGTGG